MLKIPKLNSMEQKRGMNGKNTVKNVKHEKGNQFELELCSLLCVENQNE